MVVICGPTAVGKTAVAIDIARNLNAEIISFDSRQFFIETNIGTAKPGEDQLKAIKHHFVNSHHVWENFSAGDFAEQCNALLNQPENADKKYVLVGGSGLYIDALITGMDDLPGYSLPIRQKLDVIYETNGISALQQLLKEKDEVYYHKVDINNKQRLMRALEVIELSGQPYSALLGKKKSAFDFPVIYIGLNIDRQLLYERIDARVDEMIALGLKNECISLLNYKGINALKTVGYKEMFECLEGKKSMSETIALIKQHTRNYAKRQLTWFRKNKNIIWFSPFELKNIQMHIDKEMQKLQQ